MAVPHNIMILRLIKLFYRPIVTPFVLGGIASALHVLASHPAGDFPAVVLYLHAIPNHEPL